MANLFYVGGTANIDGVANRFATTSGGAASVAYPVAGDTVTFDANSTGTATLTSATTFACASITAGAHAGTINWNGKTITVTGICNISGTGTRTWTMGAANLTCGTWTATTTTNLTFNANTSTITQTGSTVFTGGGLTYRTVVLTGATPTLNSANTFTTLTRTGTAALTNVWNIGADQVVSGTLTINANSAINRMFVKSSTFATSQTLTAATLVCTNVIDFQDIDGAGAATWTTAASGASLFGDATGNTGITFTTAATQTWSGTSGGNWSANAWTSRVPLPQDNVVLGKAWGASQTITANMPRMGNNISWAGSTGSPTWDFSSTANEMYGSLDLTGLGTITGTQITSLKTRTPSSTITSAGKSFTQQVSIITKGTEGDYILQDDFVTAGVLMLSAGFTGGLINANGHDVTALRVVAGFGAQLTMGSGTWHLTSTAADIVWNVSSGAFSSVNAGTSTIVIDNASANTRTFSGDGKSYNVLTYTVAGSTGILVITGSNTFDTINFSDTTNARTLRFTNGTTTTINNRFNVQGTSGKLMSIDTDSAGVAATLTKPYGVVVCDYLSVKDSAATGGAQWFAGSHSTNVSGNSGWQFIDGSYGDYFNMF